MLFFVGPAEHSSSHCVISNFVCLTVYAVQSQFVSAVWFETAANEPKQQKYSFTLFWILGQTFVKYIESKHSLIIWEEISPRRDEHE